MQIHTNLTEIPQRVEPLQCENEEAKTSQEEIGSPVWEQLSPLAWRDSIYSDQAKTNCMGVLYTEQVKMFKEIAQDVLNSDESKKSALIEVGFGTGELFSKVDHDFDILIGVELSQSMIDCAKTIHPQFSDPNSRVKLLQGNAMALNSVIERNAFDQQSEFWQPSTFRVTCMVMNTIGILP